MSKSIPRKYSKETYYEIYNWIFILLLSSQKGEGLGIFREMSSAVKMLPNRYPCENTKHVSVWHKGNLEGWVQNPPSPLIVIHKTLQSPEIL